MGYIFPYFPVDEAIRVGIDPVEASVVAALGTMHGQKSNTRRDKISMVSFLVIENGQYIPSHDNRVRLKSGTPNGVKQCQLGI